MKTGRTLQELASELDRQTKAKRDFLISSMAMKMEDGAELFEARRDGGPGVLDETLNEYKLAQYYKVFDEKLQPAAK